MDEPKLTRIEKIKAKYGDDFFKRMGSRGGKKVSPTKGFGHPDGGRERARKAGSRRKAK